MARVCAGVGENLVVVGNGDGQAEVRVNVPQAMKCGRESLDRETKK